MKRYCFLAALAFVIGIRAFSADPAPAGTPAFQLGLLGGASFPIGPVSGTLFTPGYFSNISAEYRLSGLPSASLALGAGYHAMPLVAVLESRPILNVGMVELGGSFRFPLGQSFGLRAYARGGAYYGVLSNSQDFGGIGATDSGGVTLSAGASLLFSGIPGLPLEFGGRWRGFLGLYDGIETFLSASLALKAPRARLASPAQLSPLASGGLSLEQLKIGNVYPVFFKYYNDHPLGSAFLVNTGESAITEVSLSFYMRQYMDSPRVIASIPEIGPGERLPVELLALFTDRMLEITEGTMAATDLVLELRRGRQSRP